MKALSLWQNYHFGPFEDLAQDYVCKLLYSFACQKKEKDERGYTNYKIPMEVIKHCKPEDFAISVNVCFGKNLQERNFSYKDWQNWRDSNFSKKLFLPTIWQLPLLRNSRILNQDKALLRIELESADVGNKIIKDFDAVKGNLRSIFSKKQIDMEYFGWSCEITFYE